MQQLNSFVKQKYWTEHMVQGKHGEITKLILTSHWIFYDEAYVKAFVYF